MNQPKDDVRLLRFRELRRTVPLSRSSIWRKVNAGEFPRPIHVGPHAVAWISTEIDEWIAGQIALRDRRQ